MVAKKQFARRFDKNVPIDEHKAMNTTESPQFSGNLVSVPERFVHAFARRQDDRHQGVHTSGLVQGQRQGGTARSATLIR